MSDQPAKHGHQHLPEGPDPIEFPFCLARIEATNVTAGGHSTSDHVAVPFHADYSPFAFQSGGFQFDGLGGIVLPGNGTYEITTYANFGDSDWMTNNFYLVTYWLVHGQALDDILGSQTMGGETLDHALAHDGTGKVSGTDLRKPEMQLGRFYRSRWSAAEQPLTVYPTYYSETSSLETTWAVFETMICYVGDTGQLIRPAP